MTKHKGEYILVIAVVVFLTVIGLLTGCDRSLQKENERLREELARQQQYVPLHKDTIRDTVVVVTQQVVEVEKIKAVLTKEDKELLKDLKVKMKELESLQKTGVVTSGDVVLGSRDTTAYGTSGEGLSDTLYYKDAWAEFEFHNKKLKYSVRDSLAIAVKKEFKHRFLWWKWGTKGYEVKIMNFNPHSTIRYNTFVKRKE